jgi:hypothetical protein
MAAHGTSCEENTKKLLKEGSAELPNGNQVLFSDVIDGGKPVALLWTSKNIKHCRMNVSRYSHLHLCIFCSVGISGQDLEELLNSYDTLLSKFITLGEFEQQMIECNSVVVALYDDNRGNYRVLNKDILELTKATVTEEWQNSKIYRKRMKLQHIPSSYEPYIEYVPETFIEKCLSQ